MRERHYYVYIMGSLSGTLYVGMTNNLQKRVWQHKQHKIEGFTQEYEVDRLLYWESFGDVQRENPNWKDLARDWYETSRGPSTRLSFAQPRSG